MKTYKIEKKYQAVTVDTEQDNVKLSIDIDGDGTFTLFGYFYNNYMSFSELCSNVKRISTVNKRAEKYGVHFELV